MSPVNYHQPYILPDLSVNKVNIKRSVEYIDQLFSIHSKILAVRVDFYFNSEFSTPAFLHKAFATLRNNWRFNQLFDGFIGYIRKIEYGIERGWHMHVLFFFNGNKKQSDYALAEAIGLYWNNVLAKSMGGYYSSNMLPKETFQYNGLGLICYTDKEKIDNLKLLSSYLCKTDTYPAEYGSVRTFATGQTPKPGIGGRPRKYGWIKISA